MNRFCMLFLFSYQITWQDLAWFCQNPIVTMFKSCQDHKWFCQINKLMILSGTCQDYAIFVETNSTWELVLMQVVNYRLKTLQIEVDNFFPVDNKTFSRLCSTDPSMSCIAGKLCLQFLKLILNDKKSHLWKLIWDELLHSKIQYSVNKTASRT